MEVRFLEMKKNSRGLAENSHECMIFRNEKIPGGWLKSAMEVGFLEMKKFEGLT